MGDICGVRIPGPDPSFAWRDCARRLRKLHRNSEESIRMNTQIPPGCVAVLAAVLLAAPLYSQSGPDTPLDPFVVVATRTPADIRTLGTAVDLITASDLSRQQITTPGAAL